MGMVVQADEERLNHPVYKLTLGQLETMWVSKYGHEWVDFVDIREDEFFHLAYLRLRQAARLEQHYLTDRAKYVCRKPE